MFAKRYWAHRYFAPRYWADKGAVLSAPIFAKVMIGEDPIIKLGILNDVELQTSIDQDIVVTTIIK